MMCILYYNRIGACGQKVRSLVKVLKQAPAAVDVNDLSSLSTNQKVKKVEAPEKVKVRDGKELEKQD